jgi:pyridoxamine 5'-phosphate oxidase
VTNPNAAGDPVYQEAIGRFQQLYDRAQQAGIKEPSAMALATADRQGRPSARMVLLRGVDQRGFVFFTNTESRKGRELADNPRAALCFYWDVLGEQVKVEGQVERISDAETDSYWASRPRDSQIGAWASEQSRALDSRATLARRVAEFQRRFADSEVPRPPYWHGFRVIPERIEFWTHRPARLHERTVYAKQDGQWKVGLLYP